MKNEDVIPTKDSDFDSFQSNLIDKVTTNAGTWNIPAAVIAILTALQALWAAAWLVAKSKTNRTSTQVTAKNVTRKNYVKKLRPFIQSWIYRNDSMTDDDIKECGLKPRDNTHTRVPVPTDVPVIQLTHAPGNVLAIRFFRLDDETGAIRRGKPEGISRIQFVYILGGQPGNPEQCNKMEEASRSPIRVNVDPNMRGQRVWFYARWINTRNEPGPWTDLDSFVL